ncbi:DUF7503 family protein [Haladaptatus sp. NG-SE-30]
MSKQDISTYLEQHPRMIGVLFAASLLLMQAGNVVASIQAHDGP